MHRSALRRHPLKRHETLDQRAPVPALINLPFPLPSIPILNPLITPLIAGVQHTTTTAAAPTTTAVVIPPVVPPAQTTSSASPSSGDGGGSSSGSGGGSSGDTGSSGSGSSGSSGDGSSGSSSGSGSSGSGSSGSGSSGSGSSESGGSTGSTGSSGSGAASGSSGSTGSNTGSTASSGGGQSAPGDPSTGGSPALSPTTGSTTATNSSSNLSTNGTSVTSSSGSVLNGTSLSSGDGLTAVNAGSDPSNSSQGSSSSGSSGSDGSGTSGGSGGSASSSQAGGSSGSGSSGSGKGTGSTGDPSDPSSPGTNASSSHGHLSGGALAGIIIAVGFFAVIAVFFVMRRRSRARRNERRMQWTLGSNYGSADENSGLRAPARLSAASSFGTPFDHTAFDDQMLRSPVDFSTDTPVPPMAQLRKPHSPLVAHPDQPRPLAEGTAETSRYSTASSRSSGSHEGQVLTIPAPAATGASQLLLSFDSPTTPMSVRPFSPSESFAFPKPPSSARPKSSENPFDDPKAGASTHRSVAWSTYTPPASMSGEINNPFADAASVVSTSSTDILPGSLETVIRPFAPTLHDELSVDPGDLVTVVTAFDDGWAQVKKKIDGTTGLIPIDCFRSMGEDVPAFLASKRVSSYFETRRQ